MTAGAIGNMALFYGLAHKQNFPSDEEDLRTKEASQHAVLEEILGAPVLQLSYF